VYVKETEGVIVGVFVNVVGIVGVAV